MVGPTGISTVSGTRAVAPAAATVMATVTALVGLVQLVISRSVGLIAIGVAIDQSNMGLYKNAVLLMTFPDGSEQGWGQKTDVINVLAVAADVYDVRVIRTPTAATVYAASIVATPIVATA